MTSEKSIHEEPIPTEFTINIPGVPPSVNHIYVRRASRYGGQFNALTDEAKQYLDDVGWAAIEGYNQCRNPWLRGYTGSLRLWLKCYFPDHRRRDADNILKLIGDGIARGLFVDDHRFLWHIEEPEVDKASPRVEVTVSMERPGIPTAEVTAS